MTMFHHSEAIEFIAPSIHRRARLMADATEREFARSQTVRIKLPQRQRPPGVLRKTLRVARDLLLAFWGVSALAFWLLVIGVGFLR
jgi:hypothetical protein